MNEFQIICLAIAGWLGSNYASYWFGLRSKRIERKWDTESNRRKAIIEYTSYLMGWKKEFNRLIPAESGCGRRRNKAAFREELPSFIEVSNKVSHSIGNPRRDEFVRLFVEISESEIPNEQEEYDRFIQKFDSLVELVTQET